MKPPRLTSALPPRAGHASGCTSMHFGENQLSPCSFGISPLPTAHPRFLQQSPVRPFTSCYGGCSLAMGGSHGFRSTVSDNRAYHTRFPSGSGYAALTRPLTVTRRVILQKARDHRGSKLPYGFHCMDAVGFRLYFTPLAGVLFTVPSRYCALSVTTSSQPWAVVDPASHAISRVAWYSSLGIQSLPSTLRDSHPLWCGVPAASERTSDAM